MAHESAELVSPSQLPDLTPENAHADDRLFKHWKLDRNSIALLGCCAVVWIGLLANVPALTALGWIPCPVLGFLNAGKKRRSVLGWTLAMLLLPFFLAPLLAILPARRSTHGGVYIEPCSLGNRLSVNRKTLTVRQRGMAEFDFPMDKLRYIYVLMPGKFWTVLVYSSQQTLCADLDLLPDEAYSKLAALVSNSGSVGGLSQVRFCIADYNGNFGQFNAKEMQLSNVEVLAELRKHRPTRLALRRAWFAGDPKITLAGAFGYKAVMDKAGYHRGSHLVAWNNVGKIQVQITNGVAAVFYVIPQGVSSSSFSLAKGKYGISISIRRQDICTTEVNFWHASFGTNLV